MERFAAARVAVLPLDEIGMVLPMSADRWLVHRHSMARGMAVVELLRREGLNFGMQLEETPGGDVRVIDQGVAPQAQLTGGEEE